MDRIINRLKWEDILNLIEGVKGDLVYIGSSIHEEWASAFIDLTKEKKVRIRICIDNSEENIRNGYGDIKAIQKLKNAGAIIKESKNLKLNYLGIDGHGTILFLESRIIAAGPIGINALKLSFEFSQQLENTFFPEVSMLEFNKDEELAEPLDESKFKVISESIQKNPPVLPDLKRQISVYNNHFQFVELSFEGGHIDSKVVSIPSDALPFKDKSIKEKMNTKYKLFDSNNKPTWSRLTSLNEELSELREHFLIPCSVRKGKSVLKISEKEEFIIAIQKFQTDLKSVSENLEREVESEIVKARFSLKKELKNFLTLYKPDSVQYSLNKEMEEHEIESEVYRILGKVKFPSAKNLIGKLKLNVSYFDLTWEDLNNEELQSWFIKNELIDSKLAAQLASINDAYKASN